MNTAMFYGTKHGTAIEIPHSGDFSEDESLSDDDDYKQELGKILANDSDTLSDGHNHEDIEDVVLSETEMEDTDWDSEDDIPLKEFVGNTTKRNKKNNKKDKLQWEDKSLNVPDEDIIFKGSDLLSPEISDLDQPYQYFKYFFTQEILSYITEQTNLYSVQTRPEKPANISEEEINAFVGICIYMSLVQLPATRKYWNSSLGIPAVSDTLTCNRFEEIKHFLHFNDNSKLVQNGNPGHDKLFKIRPFLNKVRERLLCVPKEEYMAVDEQIIPTKARSTLKQYNPKKPHKWGYKVYVLSGVTGFSYDFDFYTGPTELPGHQPDLGSSSNVVMKLTDTVPKNQNYKVFFDNWFASIPLLVALTKEGILPLGTIRINRVPNCTLPKDSVMKKQGRGTFMEKVAKVDGVDVSVVAWYDNKVVTMASTYVGSQPVSDVRRFSRKDKRHVEIPRPKCIAVYNNYMGGVDLLDSMLGYYRIRIRSKKWYLRIIFHFIDFICVNAWLLWRRANKDSDYYLPLAEFKLALSEVLVKSNTIRKKRGRPSAALQPQLDLKKRKYPVAQIPAQEVRTDNYSHLPKWEEDRQRCKYPNCTGKSFVSCLKCKVNLCLNKDRNCFYLFHTE